MFLFNLERSLLKLGHVVRVRFLEVVRSITDIFDPGLRTLGLRRVIADDSPGTRSSEFAFRRSRPLPLRIFSGGCSFLFASVWNANLLRGAQVHLLASSLLGLLCLAGFHKVVEHLGRIRNSMFEHRVADFLYSSDWPLLSCSLFGLSWIPRLRVRTIPISMAPVLVPSPLCLFTVCLNGCLLIVINIRSRYFASVFIDWDHSLLWYRSSWTLAYELTMKLLRLIFASRGELR